MTREEKSRGNMFASVTHSAIYSICILAIEVVLSLWIVIPLGVKCTAYQIFTVHNSSKIKVLEVAKMKFMARSDHSMRNYY